MSIPSSNFYLILYNVAGVLGGKVHLKRKLEIKMVAVSMLELNGLQLTTPFTRHAPLKGFQAQKEMCASFLKV